MLPDQSEESEQDFKEKKTMSMKRLKGRFGFKDTGMSLKQHGVAMVTTKSHGIIIPCDMKLIMHKVKNIMDANQNC